MLEYGDIFIFKFLNYKIFVKNSYIVYVIDNPALRKKRLLLNRSIVHGSLLCYNFIIATLCVRIHN